MPGSFIHSHIHQLDAAALIGAVGVSVDNAPYNAAGDGVTDDSAAVQAAINAAGATGGTVIFGAKTYRINSQLTFPVSADATPIMKPIRLLGQGGHWSGQGGNSNGGTVLDLRSTAAEGKIVTYGLGLLEIEHLTITDLGTSTNPYVYTTFTTLHIHDCSFFGNAAKTGTSCDQDAIICGGTTTTASGTGTNNAFQGYGTVIERNYFNKMRRALYGRVFFNGNVIRDNTVWASCGSGLAAGAAFEIDGLSGAGIATGNLFSGNLVEQGNYPYAFKAEYANTNSFIGNTAFDNTATSLFAYRLSANTAYNFIHNSQAVLSTKTITDLGTSNVYIDTMLNNESKLGVTRLQSLKTVNALFDSVGSSRTTWQSAATAAAGSLVLDVKRSALEGTDAGGTVMSLSYGGTLVLSDGSSASSSFSTAGRKWVAAGTGGAMEINSGTGGSNCDYKHFNNRFYDHTNTLRFQLKPEGTGCTVTGDWKLGTAGNGLFIKEGTNATMGVATLVAGTATVSTTKVTANSRILLTIQSLGTVLVPKSIGVTGRSAGTSFTITSEDATDTSVIAWQIVEPA